MRRLTVLLLAALTFASCDGIFGGLYDTPEAAKEDRYGFVQEDDDHRGGTIYLDVRAYERWVYVDLHQQCVDTANIVQQQPAPQEWDFALHRYDAKTHGATVAETPVGDIDMLIPSVLPEGLVFMADADSQVAVDMSQMMDGIVGYAPSDVNPVLSRWMHVDMSSMPPTYTPSNRVYLVRLADGSMAALQFTGYTDAMSNKGYATIRYRYPL